MRDAVCDKKKNKISIFYITGNETKNYSRKRNKHMSFRNVTDLSEFRCMTVPEHRKI